VPDAIEIQGKNAKIKPKKKQETVSKEKAQAPPEEESNQVAFGEGGPVSGPYGTFSAAGAKGGFGITGGGGDFGTKYSWYVHVIQQKVSENWMKYEVDPRITSAQRVYVFDIARDGHPMNVQVEQSSGVLRLTFRGAGPSGLIPSGRCRRTLAADQEYCLTTRRTTEVNADTWYCAQQRGHNIKRKNFGGSDASKRKKR
jgi:hypothetical protein